jgi:hypothetical protein
MTQMALGASVAWRSAAWGRHLVEGGLVGVSLGQEGQQNLVQKVVVELFQSASYTTHNALHIELS